jgi:UPF0755 protein
MRRVLLAAMVVVGLAIAGFVLVGPWFGFASRPKAEQPVTLIVARGDTLSAAAKKLEQAKLVSSPSRFLLLARILGPHRPIKAGEYAFYPSEGWRDYLTTMQSGRSIQRLITIPEGMPSVIVFDRLMRAPALTGTIEVPAEGSVLPDSYSYQRGESRQAVLDRMQQAMTRTLDQLWQQRKPQSVVGSKQDAIILASIVEKETGKASERPMVAGVYSNRLRQGMKLDADPTVIYPITKGRALGRRIRLSELRADNGYNTYVIAGLPAGPIANPGRESIAAVLDPAQTDALFFVADGAGGHVFAATLAEHEANRRKWYEIRRARGEM